MEYNKPCWRSEWFSCSIWTVSSHHTSLFNFNSYLHLGLVLTTTNTSGIIRMLPSWMVATLFNIIWWRIVSKIILFLLTNSWLVRYISSWDVTKRSYKRYDHYVQSRYVRSGKEGEKKEKGEERGKDAKKAQEKRKLNKKINDLHLCFSICHNPFYCRWWQQRTCDCSTPRHKVCPKEKRKKRKEKLILMFLSSSFLDFLTGEYVDLMSSQYTPEVLSATVQSIYSFPRCLLPIWFANSSRVLLLMLGQRDCSMLLLSCTSTSTSTSSFIYFHLVLSVCLFLFFYLF